MSLTKITEILGSEAEHLLGYTCTSITKNQIHLSGGDFTDRIFTQTNRSNQVLRSIETLYGHGRLGGMGYVSILPVDQGIEHSAGAQFRAQSRVF